MKKVFTIALLSTMVLGGVLATSQTVNADQDGTPGGTLTSQGSIKYFPDTDPVNPVDPDDPDHNVTPVRPDPDDPTPDPEPEPGTNGPLSLDYVPDLYFGLNKISTADETYNVYATPVVNKDDQTIDRYVPTYAQVTDKRGAYTGWTLTVAEEDQFTSGSEATLGDSTAITFTDQKVAGSWADATAPSSLAGTLTLTPNNEAQKVFAAQANEGEGTWVSSWGEVSTEQRYTANADDETAEPTLQDTQVDTSVQLTVPGSVKKMAERYVTNLDWTLTDTPAQ